MTSEGIEVYVDELAAQWIKGETKCNIAGKLSEEWLKKPEAEKLRKEIKVNTEELRQLVLQGLVDEIINNWFKERRERGRT